MKHNFEDENEVYDENYIRRRRAEMVPDGGIWGRFVLGHPAAVAGHLFCAGLGANRKRSAAGATRRPAGTGARAGASFLWASAQRTRANNK
jgi:hypothetical protein